MKRYFRVYGRLWNMSLATLVVYRANFVNSLIASLSWGFFSVISIALLISRTNGIYGWSKTDIILLTSGYQILIGIFHTLFSRNFERMADVIHFGELDGFLTKPLDSQFMLSMWWINYTSISRILLGGVFVLYITQTSTTAVTWESAALFAFLAVIGIILLYSIWFMVTTLIIWFPRMSNVVELMYTVSGISRYPGEIYKNALGTAFFLLLPVIVVVTVPVKFLVAKASAGDMLLMTSFAVVFFFLSRAFWKFALRFYTSASS